MPRNATTSDGARIEIDTLNCPSRRAHRAETLCLFYRGMLAQCAKTRGDAHALADCDAAPKLDPDNVKTPTRRAKRCWELGDEAVAGGNAARLEPRERRVNAFSGMKLLRDIRAVFVVAVSFYSS